MNDLQYIEFTRLVLGENPRIPSMEHIEELADDIEANGWQEPCTGLLNEKTPPAKQVAFD